MITVNRILCRARALRGWSQAIVAEKIGTTSKNVSRWECGETFPSPYFRERLCQLFELDADALGLLPSSATEPIIETNKYIKKRFSAVMSPDAPFISTQKLVGRESLLKDLRHQIQPGNVFAFTGLPGVGKTALLEKLTQYSQIQKRFPDGVIRIKLGPTPDVFSDLARIACHLGCCIEEVNQEESEADRIHVLLQFLQDAFATCRFLVVLDDVWTIESVLPFIMASSSLAYIVITRIPKIAFALAAHQAYVIPPLSLEASYELLMMLVPQIGAIDKVLLQQVVELTGGISLALMLIGKYLASRSYKKRLQDIEMALRQLISPGHRLNLSSPLLQSNVVFAQSENNLRSLEKTIALSEKSLPFDAQTALRAAAALPRSSEGFTEEEALTTTEAKQEVLDILVDTGFIELMENRCYRMHRVIADYFLA